MMLSPRMLRFAFLVSAIVFVCLLPVYPYPGGWVIKTIPALSLAVLALLHIPGVTGRLLSLGLLFSAAGDAALGLNDLYGGHYFVVGLALFLVAHVFYIATFARRIQVQRSRIPLAVLVVVYSSVLAVILRPGLNEMMLPVLVYIVVITLMGVLAALRAMKGNSLVYGALAFMLSDSLIAINKFLTPVPAERYLTIVTYYFAQYMIAQALVRDS